MKNRTCRATLVGLLLLTQVQLLCIAVFHWNEYQLPVQSCGLRIAKSHREAIPSGGGKDPCVVCQIVRQNAVRPSVGAPLQQPLSAVYFRLAGPSRNLHSFQPSVPNGRAPPLT